MTEAEMTVPPAMLEFLRWVATKQRSYPEAMEAWRTSCPQFSTWEDASIARYISLTQVAEEVMVTLTPRGRAIVDAA
jgi:hypothetical protein